MIPYKIFIQMILALHLSNDPKVNEHLCPAIRDASNYPELIKMCNDLQDFMCSELYEIKCEVM